MFKKSLLILSFLIAFSAKAQTNIHTIIHEVDIYYGLKENAKKISFTIFMLIINNQIDIHSDTNLKNPISYNDLNTDIFYDDSDDTKSEKDSTIHCRGFHSLEYSTMIIQNKYIIYNTSNTKHFYLDADKVLKLLSKDEKDFYEIAVNFLNRKTDKETIKNFANNRVKKLTEKIYTLGKKGNIIAYKDEDFTKKYSVNEITHLGDKVELIQIINPETEDVNDLIDTIVYAAFTVDNLKGIKIIYSPTLHSISNFEMDIHAFCPLYRPYIGNVALNINPLFYGNAKDIISIMDTPEKNLWNIIMNYHVKRKLDNRLDYLIEDYEN